MSNYALTVLAPLMIAGLALSGCGSGRDRRDETASTSAAVSDDVSTTQQDLDAVVASLTTLRDADEQADLPKLHDTLKDRTERLNRSLDAVTTSSEAAVKAGRQQDEAWNKQADAFTDANLREASQKRQSDLRASVDALATSSTALLAERITFMSHLNQTVKALDLDLTQPGLKGIRPTIVEVIGSEDRLRRALADVADQVTTVNARIAR